ISRGVATCRHVVLDGHRIGGVVMAHRATRPASRLPWLVDTLIDELREAGSKGRNTLRIERRLRELVPVLAEVSPTAERRAIEALEASDRGKSLDVLEARLEALAGSL